MNAPHEFHNEACGCFTMPPPVTVDRVTIGRIVDLRGQKDMAPVEVRAAVKKAFAEAVTAEIVRRAGSSREEMLATLDHLSWIADGNPDDGHICGDGDKPILWLRSILGDA